MKLFRWIAQAAAVAGSLTLSLAAGGFDGTFTQLKTNLSKAELFTFLYAMPKAADLHHHSGGNWQMDSLFQVATDPARNGGNRFYTRVRAGSCDGDTNAWRQFQTIAGYTWKALPECQQKEYAALDELTPAQRTAFINSLRLDKPGEGRNEFFEEIWARFGAMGRSLDVFLEMTVETMKRYGAEGVRYLEPQALPLGFVLADGTAVDPDEMSRRLKARLDQPDARATGVEVRWQVVVLRFTPIAERKIEEAYDFVSKHRDLWVGINMAGREDNDKGHPRRFLETYRRMRHKYSGVGLSIHAGEVDEPNPHMRDTLLLGATRLGHGNNVLTDDELVLHLRSGIAFVEINLVSNLLLEYVTNYSQHHFPEMLRTGIPCGLSTDDSGMWDSGMTDEYMTAVTEFNLTWDELVGCGRNSLKWSFADPALKQRLLEDYERAVKAFEAKWSNGDPKALLREVHPVAYGYAARRWGIKFQ